MVRKICPQRGIDPVANRYPAFADDVNILAGSVHTVEENTEALVVATKEIGLEVNADKTKYIIMSRDQNAGRSHSMRIDNSGRVQIFGNNVNKSKFYSGRN